MIIEHIFFGSIAVALGVLAVKYNFQLVNFTGRVEWIERYMGGGSTFAALKTLSVLLVIGGLLYMFGLLDSVLGWLLTPLQVFFPSASR